MEELKEIIRNNKMSTRPEYYSGRGATLSDLNSEILIGIHKGIKEKFGVKAAKAFVKMVANVKILSATTFLQELYDLYSRGWKVKPKKEKDASGVAIAKNEDGEYNLASGLFGVSEMLLGGDRNDTNAIRSYFLSMNGVKPKGRCLTPDGHIAYYG